MLDLTQPQSLQLILCANEADQAALREAGFRSVRVVKSPEELFRFDGDQYVLDASLELFQNFVLAYPHSASDLREQIAIRLGDLKCRWINFEKEAPAPAALARLHGPEGLSNAVLAAYPMWTDEISTMDEIPELGDEQTYESGIKGLDDHGFRFIKPAFMSVIGPYGSGKSVLLRQVAVNLWRKHRWRTLITAFEEKVKPRFQRDLRRHFIGKPIEFWSDEDVVRADAEIRQAFRFLRRPRRDVLNMDRLLSRIEYAVKVYGVDVVIIDPVNEIDHEVPKHQTKTEYLAKFIMALKAMADDYNLLVIVAAHPSKDGVSQRLSKGRLLTTNDAADSSHFGNKSDIGWAVWRPAMDSPTLLHIDKLKDHETMGRPTLAELELNPRFNSFSVKRVGYDIIGDHLQ